MNANIFATVRKEIMQSHKYLLVHMQKAREVLDHRLLAIAAALQLKWMARKIFPTKSKLTVVSSFRNKGKFQLQRKVACLGRHPLSQIV